MIDNFSEKELFYRTILKTDLASFVKKSFSYMYPTEELSWTWANDLLCIYLKAALERKIKRVIFNFPPRSLKSFTCNSSFPAFAFVNNPYLKILSASYKEDLALEQNVNTRRIIESEWYSHYFPNISFSRDQNAKNFLMLNSGGYKRSATFNSFPTGVGANFLLIDDPHSVSSAESDTERTKACENFGAGFVSRLNDPKNDIIFIIAQRTHFSDLCGYLEKTDKDNWLVIKIPVVADQDYIYYYPNSNEIFKIYKKGEYLDEKRFGPDTLEKLRKSLGSNKFSGQYMQNPIDEKGGLCKYDYFTYYENLPEETKEDNRRTYISLDAASKTGIGNDYCAFTIWERIGNKNYLLNIINQKFEFPSLKKKCLDLLNFYKPTGFLIEDASSGIALIQELKQATNYHIIPIKPKGLSKIARFEGCLASFENGLVLLPKGGKWLEEYINQLTRFPMEEHDDLVDSTSQYLNYIREKKINWSFF